MFRRSMAFKDIWLLIVMVHIKESNKPLPSKTLTHGFKTTPTPIIANQEALTTYLLNPYSKSIT